jgi:hypothetical protein
MAQIDPNIALSIRPAQIESPLVHAARAAELQGAQQNQFMNMLKMKEYVDETRNKNAMTKWLATKTPQDLNSEENLNQLATQFGAQGLALAKQIDDRRKAQGEALYRGAQISDLESQAAKRRYELGETQRTNAIKTITGFRNSQEALEMLYESEANGTIPAAAAAEIRRRMPKNEEDFPAFKQELIATLMPAEKQLEFKQPKPEKVDLNGKVVVLDMNSNSDTFLKVIREDVKTAAPRQSQLLTPEEERQKVRIAAAGRAPAAIPTPTVTMVLDPNDSTRMLSVDAKTYKGGSVGSPGVIGIAGKEPAGAKKQADKETAQENAGTIIAQLRQSFDQLDKLGGITSTKNRPGTNIGAALSSSPMGQLTGRVLGTETQSERNKIAQTRPLLMTTIMQAMGLSAKQLDSNAELKLWLSAATDPALDLEANREALRNLENLLTGKGKREKAPAAAPKPPAVGTVQDGYKFNGGNPADAKNWEKVQ